MTPKQAAELYGTKVWEIDGYTAHGDNLYDALTDSVGPRKESLYAIRIVDSFDYDAEFEYLRGDLEDLTDDQVWNAVYESANDLVATVLADMQAARRNDDWKAMLDAACIPDGKVRVVSCECSSAHCGGDVDADTGFMCHDCRSPWCDDCVESFGYECGVCGHSFSGIEAMRMAIAAGAKI